MAKALTARTVEALKPDAVRREIPDGGMTGLFLIVQPTGVKSWAYRYRSPATGKPAKITLGRYPAVTLGDAREAAGEALRKVHKAIDPADDRRAAKQSAADKADTVDALLDAFLARHIRPHYKERSLKEAERLIEKEIRPAWRGRKIQTITRRDVIALLDRVKDKGAAVTANRVLSLVRLFFNFLIGRAILDVSPVQGVKAPTVERTRDRILSDDEVKLLWRASGATGYPFGAAARLLLLTGQRREEVGAMRWSELRLHGDDPVWTLPAARTKNGNEHVVPLSAAAVDILRDLPRIDGSDFVFTTTGRTHASGYSRAKIFLDNAMKAAAGEDAEPLLEWRFHDLRRTAASGMARLAQPVHIVEAVLNHRSGTISGVAAIYNRFDYRDEKRRALEAWARFVLDLADDWPAENVVAIREAAR